MGGIIAGDCRKCDGNLRCCSVHGRNEGQQQETVPHRTERRVAAWLQQFKKDPVGQRVLFLILLTVKVLDQCQGTWKRGQGLVARSEQPEFFPAANLIQFGDEARFQPTN
ncbi:MAG: hypothetical protein WCC37_00490 [Candidatus Sulfotelmatobacter sp.]